MGRFTEAIYQKVGDEIIVASPESIGNMLSERKKSDFNWERMPVLGAEIEDWDLDEVRNTMKEYARIGNEIIEDKELFLIRNGLLKDGNLTNACIVLYAKAPAQFIVTEGRFFCYIGCKEIELITPMWLRRKPKQKYYPCYPF